MQKTCSTIFFTIVFIFTTLATMAQNEWNKPLSANDITRDTISRKNYTLVFINKDSSFDQLVASSMINAFFAVYPKEVKKYNHQALKKVIIIIDPFYKGIATTNDVIVRVNPEWMHKHPQDVDVVIKFFEVLA